jgi:phosphoglucosamine mutase
VLWELGAEVIRVGVEPNGTNINQNCGSTHPEQAAAKVRETGAHVGICLDGDADRLILLDETGSVVDGDQLMGLIATRWAREGRLAHNTLVATVMTNLGLERHLNAHGIAMERTAVGDRYVVECMRQHGFNLGGEQSGHLVMTDHATTGDGLIAALQVLASMVETGQAASQLTKVFQPVPQKLQNVRYSAGSDPLEAGEVLRAIARGKETLGSTGRLLIRKSGTEPLIRVMGEAEDINALDAVISNICSAVERAS